MENIKRQKLDEITQLIFNFDFNNSESASTDVEQLYKSLEKLITEGLAEPCKYPTHENAQIVYFHESLERFEVLVKYYLTDNKFRMINTKYNASQLEGLAWKYEREVINNEYDNTH